MKSECNEYQAKIAASFLGDLPKEEEHALEAHLAACSYCRSERTSYARTIQLLPSLTDEAAPRHFFIHQEERSFTPWRLFLQLPRRWQTAIVCAAALTLLIGFAAISRLQIQSNSNGWAISFGRNNMDESTLKKEVLEIAEKKNREARIEWIREAREIARSQTDQLQQERSQLATLLARRDSGIIGLIAGSEGQVREDTRKLVATLYQLIEQQREQDIKAVSLRLESADANNAIKAQQTNEILDTLLLTAEMKLQ
jgi:hypothetical protein